MGVSENGREEKLSGKSLYPLGHCEVTGIVDSYVLEAVMMDIAGISS